MSWRVARVHQAGDLALDGVEVRVQVRIRAASELALLEERGQPVGLLHHRAQDVERRDVARALPDRVERRVAQETRHAGLLDVAVPAQALERLDGVTGGALADVVLHHGGRDPAEGGVVLVVGAREPQRGRRAGAVVADRSEA
jgi:hypothetical protein